MRCAVVSTGHIVVNCGRHTVSISSKQQSWLLSLSGPMTEESRLGIIDFFSKNPIFSNIKQHIDELYKKKVISMDKTTVTMVGMTVGWATTFVRSELPQSCGN